MHGRLLDDHADQGESALQQFAEREARRHLREVRQNLAAGQQDPHILGLELKLMRAAVDLQPHPGDRHLEPNARALDRRFDIWGEPVQLDRPFHQPPNAHERGKNQNRDKGARPAEDPVDHGVRAAADPPRRQPVQRKAAARRAAQRRERGDARCAPVLTGHTGRASVAELDRITR